VDANSIACLNELSHLHGSKRPVRWMKLRCTGEQSVAEFSYMKERERERKRERERERERERKEKEGKEKRNKKKEYASSTRHK